MKKIRVLALIMIFAFAALGGAYAMWYDSLFIQESVATGVVDLMWGCAQSSDSGMNYTGYCGDVYAGSLDRLDPGNPNDAKNVASKNFIITNDREQLPEINGMDCRMIRDLMQISLFNGYPGYQEFIMASIVNNGTVPTKFVVTMADGTAIPDWMHFQIVTLDNQVVFDNKADINELDGLQIDPGKCVCVKIIERILQEAPERACASFTVQLKGVQWNEYNFNLPNAITADTTPAD